GPAGRVHPADRAVPGGSSNRSKVNWNVHSVLLTKAPIHSRNRLRRRTWKDRNVPVRSAGLLRDPRGQGQNVRCPTARSADHLRKKPENQGQAAKRWITMRIRYRRTGQSTGSVHRKPRSLYIREDWTVAQLNRVCRASGVSLLTLHGTHWTTKICSMSRLIDPEIRKPSVNLPLAKTICHLTAKPL